MCCTIRRCRVFISIFGSGTEIDAKDTYWTALHNASRGGHADFVELLLQRGARANVLGLEGNTPLHHAALEGHYKVGSDSGVWGSVSSVRNLVTHLCTHSQLILPQSLSPDPT